ncbi:hypothetical protein L6452_02754 [Arctium lappa]|uniref:Uncharacterized protein n=1 Tax=Arctium lappa TaxID=4217 RepID=A0ACB9FLB3_ARCLA|nr:hypothetical protein L6452_02754 [Arctium lappa]
MPCNDDLISPHRTRFKSLILGNVPFSNLRACSERYELQQPHLLSYGKPPAVKCKNRNLQAFLSNLKLDKRRLLDFHCKFIRRDVNGSGGVGGVEWLEIIVEDDVWQGRAGEASLKVGRSCWLG